MYCLSGAVQLAQSSASGELKRLIHKSKSRDPHLRFCINEEKKKNSQLKIRCCFIDKQLKLCNFRHIFDSIVNQNPKSGNQSLESVKETSQSVTLFSQSVLKPSLFSNCLCNTENSVKSVPHLSTAEEAGRSRGLGAHWLLNHTLLLVSRFQTCLLQSSLLHVLSKTRHVDKWFPSAKNSGHSGSKWKV